jgi:hypothetical protein
MICEPYNNILPSQQPQRRLESGSHEFVWLLILHSPACFYSPTSILGNEFSIITIIIPITSWPSPEQYLLKYACLIKYMYLNLIDIPAGRYIYQL